MQKRPYERSWKLLIGIPDGSLIDFETTGLDPRCDEIVTFGYIEGSALKIIQRERGVEADFLKIIGRDLKRLPQPFYAYNAEFEYDFIKTKLGLNARFVDLMEPWREKAAEKKIKWPKLGELISEPEEYFGEEVIRGENVPELWRKYLRTKNFKHLQPIIRHNQIDLLRELVLLIHYSLATVSQD